MKKIMSMLVLLYLIVSLCACGGKDTSTSDSSKQESPNSASEDLAKAEDVYTIDDLLGKWLSSDTKQIMIIRPDGTELFSMEGTSSSTKCLTAAKVENDQVNLASFSNYTISKNEAGILVITCNETNTIAKGTTFEKVEDIYTEDDFLVDWVNEETGDTMSYANGYFTYEYSNGGSSKFPDSFLVFAGDQVYISTLDAFTVVEENGVMRLNGKKMVLTRKADLEKAVAGNREEYADVFAALSKAPWLFNGGGDAILNYINFSEEKAQIGQVYFDGNGLHDNGVNEYEYVITNDKITVTTDGGELNISYSLDGEEITLGDGEYLTLSQVEEGLQGYWKYRYNSFGGSEGYLLVDQGTLKSESAHEASGGASGEYSYFGPYEGTYTMGLGCFNTDLFKGGNWFYNIIDGTPTILYYDHICVPADGFPGEDGYSF